MLLITGAAPFNMQLFASVTPSNENIIFGWYANNNEQTFGTNVQFTFDLPGNYSIQPIVLINKLLILIGAKNP